MEFRKVLMCLTLFIFCVGTTCGCACAADIDHETEDHYSKLLRLKETLIILKDDINLKRSLYMKEIKHEK